MSKYYLHVGVVRAFLALGGVDWAGRQVLAKFFNLPTPPNIGD